MDLSQNSSVSAIFLTSNQAFVSGLFRDLLNRTAEPGSLDYWTGTLDNGTSRSSVVLGLQRSVEGFHNLVARWYQNYLGRSVGNGEDSYWVNLLTNGSTFEQVLAAFLGTPEYQNRAKRNFPSSNLKTSFMKQLCQDLLNQNPNSSTSIVPNPALSNSAAASVVLNSQAYRTNLVRYFYSNPMNYITALQTSILRRPSSASNSELMSWVNSAQSLIDIAKSFYSSDEYYRFALRR